MLDPSDITMDNWLSGRLSEARRESPIWMEIMETAEEWFNAHVFPEIIRLKEARKTFTDDDEALNRLIHEFGDFFEVPEIDEESRGIQRHTDLLWRRYELHKKRTTAAFDSYVNRVMRLNGLEFKWEPLYWKAGDSYADCAFYPNLPGFSDWANNLSSRGCISLNLDSIQTFNAEWLAERISLASARAKKIIPAHLVLDFGMVTRRQLAGNLHYGAILRGLSIAAASNAGDYNVMLVGGGFSSVAGAYASGLGIGHAGNQGDSNIIEMVGATKTTAQASSNTIGIIPASNQGDSHTLVVDGSTRVSSVNTISGLGITASGNQGDSNMLTVSASSTLKTNDPTSPLKSGASPSGMYIAHGQSGG